MFEYRLSSDFDTSVAGNSLDAENEVFSRAIEVGARVRVNVNISVTRKFNLSKGEKLIVWHTVSTAAWPG